MISDHVLKLSLQWTWKASKNKVSWYTYKYQVLETVSDLKTYLCGPIKKLKHSQKCVK